MIRPSLIYKIIIAGDGAVGKTSLLHRYVEGKFSFNTKMTIGSEIFHKILTLQDGVVCSLQIWDFAGQKRFRFLLDNFVKGAAGAVLMYDLTNWHSFNNLPEWERIVRNDDSTLPILLIGGKDDLTDSIIVDDETALEFTEKNNFSGFYKTSSKTNYNVSEAFETLVSVIRNYKDLCSANQSVEI